jgi:tetratricopeptide (TPR) repeat protein
MNSFDVVFNELKKGGMGIDVKRKRDDGVLVDARENELASLGTKATVASTAGLLKKLTPIERLEWAIETKNEANELYKQKQFREAMGKYVESLAGSDFGDKDPDSSNKGNVDSLIVPVLCNLSACCIQAEEWGKAVSFADQAIQLRQHCRKAHMRKGTGLLHLGEHELALECFALAQQPAPSDLTADSVDDSVKALVTEEELNANTIMELSEADRRRLPALIAEAKRGRQQHAVQMKQRKLALAKAFERNSAQSARAVQNDANGEIAFATGQEQAAVPSKTEGQAEKPPLMTISEIVAFILKAICDFLVGLLKLKAA